MELQRVFPNLVELRVVLREIWKWKIVFFRNCTLNLENMTPFFISLIPFLSKNNIRACRDAVQVGHVCRWMQICGQNYQFKRLSVSCGITQILTDLGMRITQIECMDRSSFFFGARIET